MIPFNNTRAAANNSLASGITSGKASAGTGLSRGRGQASMDAYRAGTSLAGGQQEAAGILDSDARFNAQYGSQQRSETQNRQLAYDTLLQRTQNNAWDSRFNNMQSAWGVLTGLLR